MVTESESFFKQLLYPFPIEPEILDLIDTIKEHNLTQRQAHNLINFYSGRPLNLNGDTKK